jgi:RNA polymerase sigma factor (sigma-70 family)
MRKSVEGSALREIRAIFVSGTQIGLSDGELLMRFIDREGEAAQSAFAALVQRHGPMVFRVCRRLLVDSHDSQDAFQATFLILVRKAGSLKDRDSVGPWLFGVACRVAARSRSTSARRARHERRYVEMSEPSQPSEDPDRADLQVLIHEEIGRLPERYRVPVVLCYLGGVNQEDAAEQLGWPIGTVRSRLARARERLRGRLSRRGVALSAGSLLGTLTANASAVAPPALVNSTVGIAMRFAAGRMATAGVVPASVDALMREVYRSFFMIRLKIAMAVLATLGGTATGAGVFAFESGVSEGVASRAPTEPGLETQEGKARPGAEGRIEADELEEHRAKEKALIAELREHKAKEKALIELLEHRAKEKATIELLERRAKEKATIESREHEAKEKALKERKAKEKAIEEREGGAEKAREEPES